MLPSEPVCEKEVLSSAGNEKRGGAGEVNLNET